MVVPWQAWVPGGLTPGPCPSQRGVDLWPDQGAWKSSPCWVLAGRGGDRQGSEEMVHWPGCRHLLGRAPQFPGKPESGLPNARLLATPTDRQRGLDWGPGLVRVPGRVVT